MLYTIHSRLFKDNLYVYPVLSRRSKGISVGINLNPDKRCNFSCIYCQVERTEPSTLMTVDVQRMISELRETLDLVKTGGIYTIPPFNRVPVDLRRLSDIALSGDGEPTLSPQFPEIINEIIKIKNSYFDDLKLVLITNASGIRNTGVWDAIEEMYRNHGEVWAKLDAGSDQYFRKVSRTSIPFEEIIQNIIALSLTNPVVIQSCFNKIRGMKPNPDEVSDYCMLLKKIKEYGGNLRLVQIYTVARPPAEAYVEPLTKKDLGLIAKKVEEITDLPVEIYI